jgi:Lar family restriction alleviation protein
MPRLFNVGNHTGVQEEMKNLDLKPCPHCGGEKLRIDDSGVFEYSTEEKPASYWVACLACFATGGPGGSRKEAAEKWNKRAP